MKSYKFFVVTLAFLLLIVGCSSNNVKDVDINEVHSKVKEAYGEDYLPAMEIDEETLENLYGINFDNVDTYVAEGPAMSAHVDTFIAIKAKDGKGDLVASDLENYRDQLVNSQLMYPMNQAKVEASEVIVEGDYVFFVLLGAYNDDAVEDEALEYYKEQNNIGAEVIRSFFK